MKCSIVLGHSGIMKPLQVASLLHKLDRNCWPKSDQTKQMKISDQLRVYLGGLLLGLGLLVNDFTVAYYKMS